VPIFKNGEVVGEIDVDSDFPDAFDQEDRRLLEETARLIGEAI
jgi:GAF domain-containing protein